jgi:Carboxypeptidase regulatory-like domain
MSIRSELILRWCSLLVLCCGTYVNAQMGVAVLSGTVTDPTGALVPGAKVTLSSATENATRDTVADSKGQYVIPAIPPGTYALTVNANGFQPQTFNNIRLTSGQGSTLNVSLALSKTTQETTVTEAPPLLETTTATLGAVVDSHQFTELPQLAGTSRQWSIYFPGSPLYLDRTPHTQVQASGIKP